MSEYEAKISDFIRWLETEFIADCDEAFPVEGCMSCEAQKARAALRNIMGVLAPTPSPASYSTSSPHGYSEP